MKRVSLEKQLAGIINNGKVISSKSYGDEEIKTIQHGTFKCTIPANSVAELLKASRNMFRKSPEKYPVPTSQKILSFLYENKKVIPYFVEMVNTGKGSRWFENRIYINFPEEAKQILKKAIYGTASDRRHVLETMPRALEPYKVKTKMAV